MKLSDEQKLAMSEKGIPYYMQDALIRYYENGISPGSFLCAVLNNDLKEAFGRADDINQYCIRNYVLWLYNHAPTGSWGHADATENWLNDFFQSEKEAVK